MISAHDRVRIAARIVANPKTVLRVYQGRGSAYSRLRVVEAARELGLPPPGKGETATREVKDSLEGGSAKND